MLISGSPTDKGQKTAHIYQTSGNTSNLMDHLKRNSSIRKYLKEASK